MTKTNEPVFLLTLVICTVLFSSVSASAQNANVAGTWKLSVETSMGNGTPTFVFEHTSETSFTGTYSGQLGQAPVKGTVEGREVHFEFTIDNNLIEYSGTIEGDAMKGTLKLGTAAEGTFAGTRKAE